MALREVLGQPAAVALLSRLLSRQRLPKAVLLAGLPGCGRRTMARALARAMLCAVPVDGDACGHCQSCVLAAAGSHPDLQELPGDRDVADEHGDQSRAFKADAVRAMAEQAYHTPLVAQRRVFIVPAAERLSARGHDEAANALLKVLEEPPASVWMILTAASPDGLLKTIASRVQTFRLLPLSAPDLERVLIRQGKPPTIAAQLAQLGGGSHRDLYGTGNAPVASLLALAARGYDGALLADLQDLLPTTVSSADDKAGLTLAGVQRREVRQWFAACRVELRQRLRGGDVGAIDILDRFSAAEADLGLNLQIRGVLESLTVPQSH